MQFMMKLTPSLLSAIIIGGENADNFVISYTSYKVLTANQVTNLRFRRTHNWVSSV